jgi:transcriptional regulator with XRE-family HTH domain
MLLRLHREDALLFQDALAERAGLSPRTIRDLEAGRVQRPHGASVQLLAQVLGLELWSEMAEDTFGSLAVLDHEHRHSKAAYLARRFQRPEARLFGDVRVPCPEPHTTVERD